MPGRRATWGVLSFGDFSLHKQRKVTRSPAGRVEAFALEEQQEQMSWIPAFAGMTSRADEQSGRAERTSREDEQRGRAEGTSRGDEQRGRAERERDSRPIPISPLHERGRVH